MPVPLGPSFSKPCLYKTRYTVRCIQKAGDTIMWEFSFPNPFYHNGQGRIANRCQKGSESKTKTARFQCNPSLQWAGPFLPWEEQNFINTVRIIKNMTHQKRSRKTTNRKTTQKLIFNTYILKNLEKIEGEIKIILAKKYNRLRV